MADNVESHNACTKKKNEKNEYNLRKTTHALKKAEYLKPFHQLKRQEDIIERRLSNLISNMKIDAKIIESLSAEQNELLIKRTNITNALSRTTDDIHSSLKELKLTITDQKEIKKLNVNDYKSKLVKLSCKIQDFKNSCLLQPLYEEKSMLDNDIIEFASDLQAYCNVNVDTIKSMTLKWSYPKKENKKDNNDYEVIKDFHALIAKTGHTEKWDNEDHLLFLKIRRKCKSIPTLVRAIQMKRPDLSTEVIINHEAWYKIYLQLHEKQKLKVKEWRLKKKLEKEAELKEAEVIVEDKKDEKHNSNIPVKQTAHIATESTKIVRKKKNTDQNVEKKKELIKKWKIEREKKRAIDDEQAKIQMESKLILKERHIKIKYRKFREALKEYESKKSLEKSLLESNKISKTARKCDPFLIKAFRKQDEEYIKRKKSLTLRLNKSHNNVPWKSRPYVSAKTEKCSTLHKSTKAWNEKCKTENIIRSKSQQLLYIKDIPKLSLRWRNEESDKLENNQIS